MAEALTINEVAHFAEVPRRSVKKAIETGIVKPVKRRAMFSKTQVLVLDVDVVCYFATVDHLKFLRDIPVRRKKMIVKIIREMPDLHAEHLALEPGLHLDLSAIASGKLDAARAYLASKERHVTTDPDIFGGVPIIKGTRIPVHAVHDRLVDGDTIDDLLDDYPDIPREAFIAADIYARTHPERGRPVSGGRPWEDAA